MLRKWRRDGNASSKSSLIKEKIEGCIEEYNVKQSNNYKKKKKKQIIANN